MTRRVFVSAAHTGLAAVTTKVTSGRATFQPTVNFRQELGPDDGGPQVHKLPGAEFAVVGPGDVIGFDTGVVIRCDPRAGTVDAVENNLVTIDLSDARLPWLLNLPTMGDRPWLALVVLRDDEGDLTPGNPLPTVNAPAAALPHPDELAAWAHVEARIEAGEDLAATLATECRTGTDRVIARLVCPRRLEPNRGWLACIVPATRAGKAAGEGREPKPEEAGQPAWRARSGETLPVYYSWRFRTGEAGSFEDLARLVEPVDASDIAGFGERTIDVRHPWPHADILAGAPAEVTLTIQGALRVPGTTVEVEAWTDASAQQKFRAQLETLLDAPGQLAADRDEGALAPPLFGSHHTGHREVPGTGWMHELNLEGRHRIAASLGARYVQVEQEFLMERAWEQVGEVREANRRMAAAELAAEAATKAQEKHLAGMNEVALTVLADPLRNQVMADGANTLATVLTESAVPDGTASIGFRRLARRGGALSRRTQRAAGPAVASGADMSSGSVVAAGLAGAPAVPLQMATWLTAGADTFSPGEVAVEAATTYGTGTMVGLLDAQSVLFDAREDFAQTTRFKDQLVSLQVGMGGSMGSASATPFAAGTLRQLRREVLRLDLVPMPTPVTIVMQGGVQAVAESIRSQLDVLPQQLGLLAEHIVTADMGGRTPEESRPLRQIMAHPRFGFPIGAELLTRWPEWTIPGITTFPENSCTLLELNPPFVEAALVGLNQEFNRELLWREYPTDQAGTPFTRFWPGDMPEYGEIGLWGDGGALGSHDPTGGAALMTLLVRAEVLRRYPGTLVLAVQADAQKRVPETNGNWKQPLFTLPVDERTCIFGFDLTRPVVEQQSWMFVIREPMRGTQFGFDLDPKPPAVPPPLKVWADLRWADVPMDRGFANSGGVAPHPSDLTAADPRWGPKSADLAHIAYQRPFQVAYSPKRLLG